MKAKRMVLVAALMLCVSMFVVNCGDPTSSNTVTNDPALVGTWEFTMVSQTVGTRTDTLLPNAQLAAIGGSFDITQTFNSDLSFKQKTTIVIMGQTSLDSIAGTWSSSGSTLTTVEPGESPESGTYSISGTTLSMSQTKADTTFHLTATKQ